jgi:hypothetical protein
LIFTKEEQKFTSDQMIPMPVGFPSV